MMESLQTETRIKSLPAFSVRREFRFKETDLNQVVRTVEAVLPQYMGGDICTKVTLSEKDLSIMADTILMQEALLHLARNAIEAMPDGGAFSLHTRRLNFENNGSEDSDTVFGPCALISLSDTGIGIDEKTKERIFEPFFTTKTGNSKGLGLPVAYRIIKEHGGTMKVESTPGQGTAITIYFPLIRPEIASMAPIPLPVILQ
jgi:two-component system, cell cycle sensor histidine kinase and response regulator CckA